MQLYCRDFHRYYWFLYLLGLAGQEQGQREESEADYARFECSLLHSVLAIRHSTARSGVCYEKRAYPPDYRERKRPGFHPVRGEMFIADRPKSSCGVFVWFRSINISLLV